MKHINTTAIVVNKIKSEAKKIKSAEKITLSQAQELTARNFGYDNFHHVTESFKNTKKTNSENKLGSLKIKSFPSESVIRFDVEDHYNLDRVTEGLDDFVDLVGGGVGDMTVIPKDGLKQITSICRRLTINEPAFLDGYAHWVGALVALNQNKEAIQVGMPVFNACCELLKTAPNDYKLSYYELSNRPFYRLAINIVLALYGDNQNDEAKNIAMKMLKMWPDDNMGFRFLLEPESEGMV